MATCIEVEHYGHPGSHPPEIITQDVNNRFVTDAQIDIWNAKVDQSVYDAHVHTLLRNAADTVTGLSVDAAGNIVLLNGVAVNEFSSDTQLSGESDQAVPTERAVKQYIDNAFNSYLPYRLRTPDNTNMSAFVIDVAGRASFPTGVGINRFSSDATFANDSDLFVPTERAVKGYVDTELASTVAARNVITDALDSDITTVETNLATHETSHTNALSQTLNFGGGASGDVATMTVTNGLITAVTLVP
jgi:hypothetical protein